MGEDKNLYNNIFVFLKIELKITKELGHIILMK
jgi:hypothetical protein